MGTRARRGFSSSLFARARHASTTTSEAIMVKKRGANQHTGGKPFLEWCAENGKRGERLANEFREELPTELTKGSRYKAKWKCLSCKHAWRATVNNRTKSFKPTGCPSCAKQTPATKTNNFLTWCNANGDRGKKLLKEFVDPDKEPTQVTKASNYKALWKCETCEHEWRARMDGRTRSVRPSGCPQCNPGGRKKKRQRED